MNTKILAENKKVGFDYFIVDTVECGIELKGTEVKSIRNGNASIKEAWCDISNGELWVRGMNVSPYEQGNRFNVEERRERRLLAHKSEIIKLNQNATIKGMTIVPLKIYSTQNGKIKILVGLCKGKHTYDKKESLKERDIKREIERGLF